MAHRYNAKAFRPGAKPDDRPLFELIGVEAETPQAAAEQATIHALGFDLATFACEKEYLIVIDDDSSMGEHVFSTRSKLVIETVQWNRITS